VVAIDSSFTDPILINRQGNQFSAFFSPLSCEADFPLDVGEEFGVQDGCFAEGFHE